LKAAVGQSGKSRDVVNMSILLAVALCIGIYLIATTGIIAKDGVTFINYAGQLEIAPVKTMVNEFQHPGYPWLILTAHKVADFLHANTSILSWIYCGQSVTLVFRLFAITVLYFIGKHLFGAGTGFWATLILILLPKPAGYGSDALSDWPHLCFLVAGLLLLFKGAASKKWWMFGLAGLAAGAGYLIRPECAQLVVLGGLWLVLQLFLSRHTMKTNKVFLALSLLLVGFGVIAGPYMNLKSAVFPKKNVGQFAQRPRQPQVKINNTQAAQQVAHKLQFTPSTVAKAFGKLVGNIGETLMWFFVPALILGMHKWFKTRKWYEPEKFFVIAIIVLNIPVMIWLHCRYGYMSVRHTLPLMILPILYVPVGLQELAIWLQQIFPKKAESPAAVSSSERFWFLVLFFIGFSICAPKLLRPIRVEKQGYRAAAKWLKANTDSATVVAVPDKRISFYAQRRGLVYEDGNIPAGAEYVVKIFRKQEGEHPSAVPLDRLEYEYVDKSIRGTDVIIYQNL